MIAINIEMKISHSQEAAIGIKLNTKDIEPTLGFTEIRQEAPTTKEIK